MKCFLYFSSPSTYIESWLIPPYAMLPVATETPLHVLLPARLHGPQMTMLAVIQTPQIILSQEKNIQRLNELVQSLQLQLLQCRGSNNTLNDTATYFRSNSIEIQKQNPLED
ncbi:hypothetical protein ZIOFF_017562 [Zingiber officinale]|uniref:Uncharacterized protein n=1 Tax=Zingiber officinale TaxID=94328 RepID=A0A8J5HTN9_ZINOF|nr:hypothetical protein ZIOFF_017562 [Zingiber officinale]